MQASKRKRGQASAVMPDRFTTLPTVLTQQLGNFLPLRDLMRLRGVHSSLYETHFHQRTEACLVRTNGAMLAEIAQERTRLEYLSVTVSGQDLVGMRETFANLHRFRLLRVLEIKFDIMPDEHFRYGYLHQQHVTLNDALDELTNLEHPQLPLLETVIFRMRSRSHDAGLSEKLPKILTAFIHKQKATLQHVCFESEDSGIQLPVGSVHSLSNLTSLRMGTVTFDSKDVEEFGEKLRYLSVQVVDASCQARLMSATEHLRGLYIDYFDTVEGARIEFEHLDFFHMYANLFYVDYFERIHLPTLQTWILRREAGYDLTDALTSILARAIEKFPLLRVLSLNAVYEDEVEQLAQDVNAFERLEHLYLTFRPLPFPDSPSYEPTSPTYSWKSPLQLDDAENEENDEKQLEQEYPVERKESDVADEADEPLQDPLAHFEICIRLLQSKLRKGIVLHYHKKMGGDSHVQDDTFLTPQQLEANYLLQHGYSTLSPCSNPYIPQETIKDRIHVIPGHATASDRKKQRL
jgi:hypothetical protein